MNRLKKSDNWKICAIFGPLGAKGGTTTLVSTIHLLEPLAEEMFAIAGNLPEDIVSRQKTHIINLKVDSNSHQPMLKRIPAFIMLQLRISYHLIRIASKVDIVFLAAGASTMLLPALAAKLWRKRIIFMRHGTDSFQKIVKSDFQDTLFGAGKYIFPPIWHSLIRLNCSLCDKLVVFRSDSTDPRLRRYTNKISFSGSRFYVDTRFFKVERSLDSRESLVGYIGQFLEEKGVINLVKAIPVILGDPAVGFVIGGDGPLRNEIEREIKNANLGDKATLVGWVHHNKIPQFLNELKLLVIPFTAEVGPHILFEAIACGTPVLATPVGVVPDVIKDGETGFIMEDNSPQCIARNVTRALNHPNLNQIAKAAQELVEREYTHQAAVERYRRILTSLPQK